MQYDTVIANRFGTDVDNSHFMDVVLNNANKGINRSEFVCDDNSFMTVFVPEDMMGVVERDGKSIDAAELSDRCYMMVIDHASDDVEPVWYRPTSGVTALEQYLDNHEDVRACRLDTYSNFAYDEYVSAQAIEMFEHCMDVIDTFESSGKDFDADAYTEVVRSKDAVLARINELGIIPYYTDYETINLDISEACCRTGLVMTNDDIYDYVDSYHDVHDGDSPDRDSYVYLSDDEERKRIEMCKDAGLDGADVLLDVRGYNVDDEFGDEAYEF